MNGEGCLGQGFLEILKMLQRSEKKKLLENALGEKIHFQNAKKAEKAIDFLRNNRKQQSC